MADLAIFVPYNAPMRIQVFVYWSRRQPTHIDRRIHLWQHCRHAKHKVLASGASTKIVYGSKLRRYEHNGDQVSQHPFVRCLKAVAEQQPSRYRMCPPRIGSPPSPDGACRSR